MRDPTRRRVCRRVALASLVALVAVGCSPSASDEAATRTAGTTPSATAAATPQARPAHPVAERLAVTTLHRLATALAERDKTGYLSAWASGSGAPARATYHNLTALDIHHLSWHYVATTTTRSPTTAASDPQQAQWTADVGVTWRPADFDGATAHTVVTCTFQRRGDRAVLVGIRPDAGHPQPVWTLPRLHVQRTPRTVVAGVSADRTRAVSGWLQRAVTDLGRVLPNWQGRLLAYVPAQDGQFLDLLAADPQSYKGIAAITVPIDGSRDPQEPTAIVLNPSVFPTLGPTGAQVIITHEATHAATGVAASSMPLWLAEGFADYVAVGSVDLPLRVAASAAIDAIRQHGVPSQLPPDSAFGAGHDALEATYEKSWLAARLIAETYGRRSLVAFYQYVVAHPRDIEAGFTDVLGTTQQAFTAQWQRYLQHLVADR